MHKWYILNNIEIKKGLTYVVVGWCKIKQTGDNHEEKKVHFGTTLLSHTTITHTTLLKILFVIVLI